MKKITKVLKINKAILAAILSILLVFTTSVGSSVHAFPLILIDFTSFTVGTDTNESILHALIIAKADETITLKGEGEFVLSILEHVACSVVITPTAGKNISIVGGTFNGTVTLKCPGSTEVVSLKFGHYQKIDIIAGKVVLDGAIVKNTKVKIPLLYQAGRSY